VLVLSRSTDPRSGVGLFCSDGERECARGLAWSLNEIVVVIVEAGARS